MKLRRALVAALAVSALALTSACSSQPSDKPADTATESASSFPVTIKHSLGETTIESKPERVVTLAWTNADIALSLGVVPVAMHKETYSPNEHSSTSWADDKLAELGAGYGTDRYPTLIDETNGVNFDEVVKAKPDLILVASGGMKQEDYDKLSQIAPTIAPLSPNYTTKWQDATEAAGQALGKTAEAKRVIDETNQRFTDFKAKHPDYSDLTVIAGALDTATNGVSFYNQGDGRARFFVDLGFTMADVVKQNETAGAFYTKWTPERADELKSDIFFTWLKDGQTPEDVAKNAALSRIPAVASGAFVATPATKSGKQLSLSISTPNPLTIPFTIDNMEDQIVAAADKAKAAK